MFVCLWKYMHTYKKRMYSGYILPKKVHDYIILYTLSSPTGMQCHITQIIHVLQLLCVPSLYFIIIIYPLEKVTVVKLSVIIVLICVATLNITLVGAIAITWKISEHIIIASQLYSTYACNLYCPFPFTFNWLLYF